jgi:inosose dehydratase
VTGGLHRSGAWEAMLAETRRVAQLTRDLGGAYLVFLPEMYRDDRGGRIRDWGHLRLAG